MESRGLVVDRILFVDLQHTADLPPTLRDLAGIATTLGASITLFDVIGDTPHRSIAPFPGRTRNRRHAIDRRTDAVTERYARWRDQLDADLDVSTSVGEGRWAAAVISEIANGAYDLVVVSSTGGGNAVRRIRRLLRTCPAPLLVIRDAMSSVDVVAEVRTPDHHGLNARVAACAATFSDALGVDLSMRATQHLIRPGHATGGVVDEGDPRLAGLVVIGESGHLRATERLTGNAAEKLLAATSRSLLVVDPAAAKASRRPRSEPRRAAS